MNFQNILNLINDKWINATAEQFHLFQTNNVRND